MKPAPLRSLTSTHAAVFLDKDGTLVENLPYNVNPELVRFTANALEGLKQFRALGYELVLVTNQPGIAQGRFSVEEFETLAQALQAQLSTAGVPLSGVYFCPHAPDDPACACRKPKPALLRRAAAELDLDLAHSWMIGDILDDVEAGRRAGCRSILVNSGGETEWHLSPLRTPFAIVDNLFDAAAEIAKLHVRVA